jgi:6-phosphogluconolactonase
MTSQLHSYPAAESMQQACADVLEHHIRLSLAKKGNAFLSLAGGSALAIYRKLSQAELDWRQVTIVPTDERWVSQSHSACNLAALKSCFAARNLIQWLSLVPDLPPDFDGDAGNSSLPSSSASKPSAHSAIKTLASMPMPFDAVLLGMGLDAHTASLFPGTGQLTAALALKSIISAVAITPKPLPAEAPFARISLTASRLLHADAILLAITGAAKREVLNRALLRDDEALPISRFLHAADANLQIYWSV